MVCSWTWTGHPPVPKPSLYWLSTEYVWVKVCCQEFWWCVCYIKPSGIIIAVCISAVCDSVHVVQCFTGISHRYVMCLYVQSVCKACCKFCVIFHVTSSMCVCTWAVICVCNFAYNLSVVPIHPADKCTPQQGEHCSFPVTSLHRTEEKTPRVCVSQSVCLCRCGESI